MTITGRLLLVAWCSGDSNMNVFASKEDFDACNVRDATPHAGPISYAVNTAVPGLAYLGSGVGSQCQAGRKIAINILKYQV